MDIFGKTSTKSKNPFQNELQAKMKERKDRGLGAELTETEDDDDALDSDEDILAAFSRAKPSIQPRSQSPWNAQTEGRTTPKAEILNRSSPKESKPKQKIPIKPKNELDRLLADDEEDEGNLLRTQKKPWQPPKFKDFSKEDESNKKAAPQPRERASKQSPFIKTRQQSTLEEESEGESDDELTGAYTRQLQQRASPGGERRTPVNKNSSFGSKDRQSPLANSKERQSPGLLGAKERQSPGLLRAKERQSPGLLGAKERQSPGLLGAKERQSPGLLGAKERQSSGPSDNTTKENMASWNSKDRQSPGSKSPLLKGDKQQLADRSSPKTRDRDDMFGSNKSSKKPSGNLDDIFGKRKSPSDKDLFGSKIAGESKTPDGLRSPKPKEKDGRKTPQEDMFGRKDDRKTPQEDPFSRKSPKQQNASMDDIFGGKKRAESPLFKSKLSEGTRDSARDQIQPQPATRKGSYMSKLLGDADEQDNAQRREAKPRSSYLDSLLGDEKPEDTQTKGKSSYLDSLLGDEKTEERRPRPRQRTNRDNSKDDEEERDSSLCRDVDKDPMMIAKLKAEREEKKQLNKGKAQTEKQQAEFDIDEVADAQSPLAMTYIKPETTAPVNRSSQVTKPKARKPISGLPTAGESSSSTTPTFESATDIRNYIYKEWREKKQTVAKQNVSEKRQREKEEQMKKEKDIKDKKLENEATFRTWKERKDETLRERLRKAKQEEKKKEEEERKQVEKKRDAEKLFKNWKESKDEEIIYSKKKSRKGEIEKLTEKQEEEARKKKDSEGAFNGWKKRKDKEIRHTLRHSTVQDKQVENEKLRDTRRREIEAEQLYDKWLQRKEEQKKREKLQMRTRSSFQESPRPAWSPANKTIPTGR